MDDLAKGWAILAAQGSGHAGADIAIIVATLTSLAIGVVVAMRGERRKKYEDTSIRPKPRAPLPGPDRGFR